MTVNTVEIRKTYNGNGVTDAFATPYFLADADLAVYVDGVLQTITTDYTVAGAGVPAGGTVTFVTPPPTGTANVVIIRDPALTQLTDWVENDANGAEVKETAFDKLTMIAQRQQDKIDRSLRLQDFDLDVDMELPLKSSRVNKFLAFNSDGEPVASAFGSTGDAQVFSNKATAVAYIDVNGIAHGQAYFITSDDGGPFTGVTGASAATYADDSTSYCGTQFIPTGGDGSSALVRQYSGNVDVRWFGAVADWNTTLGTGTDNAAFIKDAAKLNGVIEIPKGNYGTSVITFWDDFDNTTIVGDGRLYKIGSGGMFSVARVNNFHVKGLWFNGRITYDETTYGAIYDVSPRVPYAYGIALTDCSNSSIENCHLEGFANDGITVTGTIAVGGGSATQSGGIEIINNYITQCRNTMILAKALDGFKIIGNKGINPTSFEQKGNFIYPVEWCHNGVIESNRGYWIGDNFIGIGQLENDVDAAKNKHIIVKNNISYINAYHSILIASSDDIIVEGNYIYRPDYKEMHGTLFTIADLIGAGITVLGGTDGVTVEPTCQNISISNNIIDSSYEIGIYGFDRTSTTAANASKNITIENNIIKNGGAFTFSDTGLHNKMGGIRLQYEKPPKVINNTIDKTKGHGIAIVSDGIVKNNHIVNCIKSIGDAANEAVGIHVIGDTAFSVNKISGPIEGNTVTNCEESGIFIQDRDNVVILKNTCIANGTSGGASAIDAVAKVSGIAVSDCGNNSVARLGIVRIADNLCQDNVACGIVVNDSKPAVTSGNVLDGNGTDTGLAAAWRCGLLAFGAAAGYTLLESTKDGGEDGGVQQYGVRVNNGAGSTVIEHNFAAAHATAVISGASIATLASYVTGTIAYAAGAVAAGATVAFNITVTGAAFGDYAMVAPPDAASSNGLVITATVVGTNLVKVVLYNPTAGTITPTASGTWTATAVRIVG